MSGPTAALWITHNPTTLAGIRGLLEQLESVEAPAFAQIKIMALDPDGPSVRLSKGELTMPDGHVLKVPEGQVLTWDKVPAQGLLFIAREKDD